MFKSKKNKKVTTENKRTGFTLIELLVAVSVIGILSGTTYTSLSGARTSSRDIERISDIRQIGLAMEINRNFLNDQYAILSTSTPTAIPELLKKVPTNNLANNGSYEWLDNTARPKEFCAWATLEDYPLGDFFISNHVGAGYYDEEPTSWDNCDFLKVTSTQNQGGESGITLCHVPGNKWNKRKTIIVGSQNAADAHLGNHGLDQLGDCP